jgi:hypothetical protein
MCPGVDSASKNEYQVNPGCKDGRCVRLTTYYLHVPMSRNLGALTSWKPVGLFRFVMGQLYLFTFYEGWREEEWTGNNWDLVKVKVNDKDLAVPAVKTLVLCRFSDLTVAGLSSRSFRFNPRSVHAGYVVDKVAMEQIFLPSNSVYSFPLSFHQCPLLINSSLTDQSTVLLNNLRNKKNKAQGEERYSVPRTLNLLKPSGIFTYRQV